MFKPMLAKAVPEAKLRFPLAVQPKLDGIRISIVDGEARSRSNKPIRNKEIQAALGRPEFNGFDGEVIVGPATAKDVFRRTESFVMAADKTGEPWVYNVFDKWDAPGGIFDRRESALEQFENPMIFAVPPLVFVKTYLAETQQELDIWEQQFLAEGFEGAIARNPTAPYKQGRGGVTNLELVKIKRFVDGEAQVVDMIEEFHNANEAYTNELGRTQRSTAKSGRVGKGTLGALVVEDLETGVRFNIGTGFSATERWELWAIQFGNTPISVIGKIVKYKHQTVGAKDKPRLPVFLGFRDEEDM